MLRSFLAFLFLVAIAGSAAAEAVLQPLPIDRRISEFHYDENTVYPLDLHLHFISTIRFDPGEVVKSIQVGDSASWQILRLKRGDTISVKPRIADAVTNMTVITDRNRIYTFLLRAHDVTEATPFMNFRVSFTYPAQDLSEFGDGKARREQRRNYYASGPEASRPIEVYDDGRQTFFVFADTASRPAVFRVDDQGFESLVNATHRGNTVVVDGVSSRWSLRIGEEIVCVAHEDFVFSAANDSDDLDVVKGDPG